MLRKLYAFVLLGALAFLRLPLGGRLFVKQVPSLLQLHILRLPLRRVPTALRNLKAPTVLHCSITVGFLLCFLAGVFSLGRSPLSSSSISSGSPCKEVPHCIQDLEVLTSLWSFKRQPGAAVVSHLHGRDRFC